MPVRYTSMMTSVKVKNKGERGRKLFMSLKDQPKRPESQPRV